VGVEDELLPHKNSQDNAEQIKEERRLLYVGMSRAQYFLYVSFCGNRWMYSKSSPQRVALLSRVLRLFFKHRSDQDAIPVAVP